MTRYKLLVQTNSLRQSLQLTEGSWCRSADDLLLEVEMYLHINHHLADLKDIRSGGGGGLEPSASRESLLQVKLIKRILHSLLLHM